MTIKSEVATLIVLRSEMAADVAAVTHDGQPLQGPTSWTSWLVSLQSRNCGAAAALGRRILARGLRPKRSPLHNAEVTHRFDKEDLFRLLPK